MILCPHCEDVVGECVCSPEDLREPLADARLRNALLEGRLRQIALEAREVTEHARHVGE